MLRRWCILLAMLALAAGTALTTTSASATTTGGTFSPGGPIHLVSAASSHARGISHQAESTNWSGYAGTTGTYTSVSASWTQPAGKCSSGDQYAAFWVGLDGYSSSSVEQTGSEVDCVGRTAEYYAWYEMYPGPSETYSNTVGSGDHFNASVTYEGSNKFSLYIADTTRGWSHTTTASLAGAARSSAEVIVEAPCCTNSGGILPLTDFGTVNITGSEANGAAIGKAGGLTEITMIDNEGRDKDTVSSLSGGENFSATWVRSN
jgi:peptidase A4-like protein